MLFMIYICVDITYGRFDMLTEGCVDILSFEYVVNSLIRCRQGKCPDTVCGDTASGVWM